MKQKYTIFVNDKKKIWPSQIVEKTLSVRAGENVIFPCPSLEAAHVSLRQKISPTTLSFFFNNHDICNMSKDVAFYVLLTYQPLWVCSNKTFYGRNQRCSLVR